MGTAKKRARKPKVEPASRGLAPAEMAAGAPSTAAQQARASVEERGGKVLATFRDPLGGNWQLLAALPLEAVAPTPFQRARPAAALNDNTPLPSEEKSG